MKILFLDIDGCLNNNYVGDYYIADDKRVAIGFDKLNPILRQFFKMCKDNDVKIVWMTDWRKYISYDGLNSLVEQAGFDTSQFICKSSSVTCKIGSVSNFLEENDVDEYCIVDNDHYLLWHFDRFGVDITKFVITNNAGITCEDIEDMKKILKVD